MTGQEEMASSYAKAGLDRILKSFFMERVGRQWNRVPRAVVQSPLLEVKAL